MGQAPMAHTIITERLAFFGHIFFLFLDWSMSEVDSRFSVRSFSHAPIHNGHQIPERSMPKLARRDQPMSSRS